MKRSFQCKNTSLENFRVFFQWLLSFLDLHFIWIARKSGNVIHTSLSLYAIVFTWIEAWHCIFVHKFVSLPLSLSFIWFVFFARPWLVSRLTLWSSWVDACWRRQELWTLVLLPEPPSLHARTGPPCLWQVSHNHSLSVLSEVNDLTCHVIKWICTCITHCFVFLFAIAPVC